MADRGIIKHTLSGEILGLRFLRGDSLRNNIVNPKSSNASQPRLVLFTGHSAMITTLAFAQDGKTIATGSNDRSIILWDAHTGEIDNKLLGHRHNLFAVAFSPDGKTLASADWEETRLWDVASGEEIKAIPCLSHVLQFSPDGSLLASTSAGKIVLWDIQENRFAHFLGEEPLSWQYSLAFSPNGVLLAVADSCEVQLWDTQTGKLASVLRLPEFTNRGTRFDGEIYTVSFSADGDLVAVDYNDRVVVWNVDDGTVAAVLDCPKVSCVEFAEQGAILIGCGGGNVAYWDSDNWETKHASELVEYHALDRLYANCCWLSPNRELLASMNNDTLQTVGLWSMRSGSLIATLRGMEHSVTSVAYTSDGKELIIGHSDGTVRVWNAQNGRLVRTEPALNTPISKTAVAGYGPSVLSPDGKLMAASTQNDCLQVWDVETGILKHELVPASSGDPSDALVTALALSPDGSLLAIGYDDRFVTIWDVNKGALLKKLKWRTDSDGVAALAFSNDGATLAVGLAYEDEIHLWNTRTGKEIRTLADHSNNVNSLAYSPDGRTLASGSSDGTIKIWNSRQGCLILTLMVLPRDGDCSVSNEWIAFTPNGDYIGSGEAKRYVRWQVGGSVFTDSPRD